MTIFVVYASQHKDAVYIGRRFAGREASVLGNSFRTPQDGTAEEVVKLYLAKLRRVYQKRGAVYKELHRLADIYEATGTLKLGCWCRKDGEEATWAQCHGDVVKDAILGIVKQRKAKNE